MSVRQRFNKVHVPYEVKSRSIVERHGGDITVESELGNGSTFWLSLPILREDSELAGKLARSRGEAA